MMARATLALAIALGLACDAPSRERIDRWRGTRDGAERLVGALASTDVAADLRARAAQHLVAMGDGPAAVAALRRRPSPAVLDALIPLLAGDARVASELQVPTPGQVAAKDALFELRPLATPAQRELIDGDLADWLAGYYEGRSGLGRHSGREILGAVGARAAPGLTAALEGVLAEPAPSKGRFVAVRDELLEGLALAGPPGVAVLLDLAQGRRGARHPDATLPTRAMRALGAAYVDRDTDAAPLLPGLDRLESIAGDTDAPPALANLAFDLIAATGPPHCLRPLTALARHPDAIRVWVAVREGLDCAGVDAIVPLAEALLPERDLEPADLERFFWAPAAALGPGAAVPARTLLASESWLARLSGVKLLERVGSAGDAERLRAIASDSTTLRWSREHDTKWAAPTLGAEAARVADHLEKKP
jgi:hypothetical protein